MASIVQPSSAQGTCVGFAIQSDLAFATLRDGGGTPLTVSEAAHGAIAGEPLLSWRARPDNPFEGRLVAVGSRYAFWANDAGWYMIDPTVPSIEVTPGALSLRRELRLFGVPATLCALAMGDLSIHAAAVDVGGHAVLLAGPSHHGKTTLAGAFAGVGHRLLAEDSIRVGMGPPPVVHPGPAAIRLRPDVAAAIAIPGARPVTGDEGRVPLVLDPASRGSGYGVPLRAILILRQADELVTVERIPAARAIPDLLALSFQLPSPASRAETFGRIADLVAQVPAFDLYRPMTTSSLGDVVARIEDLVSADP